MRVHANQIDANYALNAAYVAAKADAKEAAERTRRRLMNAALAGHYDDAADCVVSLSGEGAAGDEASRREPQQQGEQKADSEGVDDPFSDWA